MTLLKKFKKLNSKKKSGLLSSFHKLPSNQEDKTKSYFKKKMVFKRLNEEGDCVAEKTTKKKKKPKKKLTKTYTCEDCPLYNTTHSYCIKSDGPLTAPVLFVGEAPGRTEDKEGAVFCGTTGRLFRDFISDSEFNYGEFRLTNTVRCHPGLDNKGKDNKPPAKAVSCCLRLLKEEISRMPNLNVIVPLGAAALKAVTGKTGITAWCGQRIESNLEEAKDIPVVPNFHPSYINRNENEITFAAYLQDLLDIHEEFVEGKTKTAEAIETNWSLVDSIDQLDKMLEYLNKFEVIAFDVETHGLFPYHEGEEILTLSFSAEPGIAFCVPYKHKDANWSVSELKIVHKKIKRFLEGGKSFVAHNAQFDCMQLKANFDTAVSKITADTMLIHYTVDETRGTHSLERLAYVYTDMGGYDKELNEFKKTEPRKYDPARGGSYNNIPIKILYPYSAGDSDCCLRIYHALTKELEEHEYSKDLMRIAFQLMTRAVDAITYVQNNGAYVDKEVVAFLDNFYKKKMNDLVKQMSEVDEVVEFITDKRKEARVAAKQEEEAKRAASKRKIKRKSKKKEEFEFNPDSPAQIRELFFGYLGLTPVKETDKGQLSTDEEVLEALTGEHKLVDLVKDYRTVSKLHGTYVKSLLQPKGHRPPLICRDSCLRSSYLLHGTTTGRLSSRSPNLQNIPRQGDIKKMFVSRFGEEGVIMEADYSQIELRIAAMLSQDEVMMSVYEEDGDLHMETACSIFNASAEELDGDKEKRSIAKRTNFGIVYGTGAQGLVDQLKKEGIEVTKQEGKEYIDKFYETYLGIGKWIEEQERFTTENLISISPFGRIRHLPQAGSPDNYLRSDALRAAINHPIQSAASDCTLLSLSKLSCAFRERNYKSMIVMTVHDSIIFDVLIDELEEIVELVSTTMNSVKDWAPKFIPGLDTSWLRLPVKSDIEIGWNWKELEEYDLSG